MMNNIVTFKDGNRTIGLIKVFGSRRVFVTRRKRDYIDKFSKFAIDETILEYLRERGVKDILIICETEEGDRLLWSSVHDWYRYGQVITDVSTGRSKIVCPVSVMKVEA